MTEQQTRWEERAVIMLVLAFVWGFLLVHYKPSLLLLDTMNAGGDTPSFLRPVHHLRDVLLPAGNPLGWDLANFAGYAPYQYYFLPPSLAIVALSTVMPLNVAFKLVTAVGVFLLPLCAALAFRAMGYRFPAPAIAAASMLIFLFNEGNSMWGGNIPSSLAGEFSFAIGFALSILFLGLLYRGIERQRGWRSLGVLLALTGLCHPVAFLNATAPGLFFLLRRQHFVRNLRFIFAAYGTAVLLMSFWLIPLIAKLGYATSINWKWFFRSWTELLPQVLWPVMGLALANAVWLAVRRRPENRPAHYMLLGVGVTVLCFLNSTEVGLPEIRFVPFAYILLLFLAVDLVCRMLPLQPERWPAAFPLRLAPHVGAIALSLGCGAWSYAHMDFIPNWIKWNYEGLELKPSWRILKGLSGAVKGSIGEPRVAYENSPKHERFGSMRVFESMALLTGRATLEGVLLQTAVNSPFIYWLQSQISKQGTGVIPGYSYPSFDPSRSTKRLALFNAHDMIVLSPEAKQAFGEDPHWELSFSEPPYEVYHLEDADPHYVRVPRYQPVLLETEQWKHDFHDWFARDELLDIPLVAAHSVPEADRSRFSQRSASPTELPREPINVPCEIEERIDHLEIEFTTSCPGLPHWIAVSYFPNWQSEGASRVFLASPGFMLVFPEGNRVRLSFRRIPADWLGLGLSLIGIGLCLVRRFAVDLSQEPSGRVVSLLGAGHRYAVPVVLVAVLGITLVNVARDVGPDYLYKRGWKAFQAKDYVVSERYFTHAMRLGGKSTKAAEAAFFRAASLLRAGETARALDAYQHVVDVFPSSYWVPEAHYHVGLCLRQLDRHQEAAERFRFVMGLYAGNRWAGFAAQQLKQLEQQGLVPSGGSDG